MLNDTIFYVIHTTKVVLILTLNLQNKQNLMIRFQISLKYLQISQKRDGAHLIEMSEDFRPVHHHSPKFQ